MFVCWYFGTLLWLASGQLASAVHWTPIHTDNENSIDLWTKESTGCTCPHDPSSRVCACCVDGGCNCGPSQPSRCTQCGLESRCLDLCNVTIDAHSLAGSSNKTFGQIKSPSELRGQTVCWYKFRSSLEKRIELQLYRIVGMGQKNHTSCNGGGISWYYDIDSRKEDFWDGAESPLRLCGLNERFFPPVTLFGDSATAALVLRFDEHFERSRFLAYFSFTDGANDILGFQTIGGTRLGDTACNYEFSEAKCKSSDTSCTIASPGFPGLYPPNRTCRYSIDVDSPFTVVRLEFSSVSFSESLCQTDDVLIFRGKVKPKLMTRLCGRNKTEFRLYGPSILVEFRSGSTRPALEYNGFKATIRFEDAQKLSPSNRLGISEDALFLAPERVPSAVCDYAFPSKNSRSGLFTSDTSAWRVWPAPCTMHFIGNPNDTVLINLMKYKLSGPDCRSYIEVYDIPLDVRWPTNPAMRICSPAERQLRGGKGFNAPQIYKSRGHGMALRFKLDPADGDHIVEGAFAFQEGLILGENPINADLHIVTIDESHGESGLLLPTPLTFIHWNAQTPVQLVTLLKPSKTQKVTVEFNVADLSSGSFTCVTDCGRGGCLCRWVNHLAKGDHIIVQELATNATLLCLCGNPTSFLPLRLTSNHGLRISIISASHAWPDLNVLYNITWHFRQQEDYYGCQTRKLYPSSGFLQENRSISETLLYHGYSYYFRSCSWLALMEEGEQLITSISTSHTGPCSDWNTTFSLLDSVSGHLTKGGDVVERILKVVCPDQPQNMFVIPPMVQQIQIRLTSYTMIPTDFRLQWQTTQYIIPTPGDRALSPHSTESGEEMQGQGNKTSETNSSSKVGFCCTSLLLFKVVIVLAVQNVLVQQVFIQR